MLDNVDKELLEKIADLHEVPTGAYNIRKNGGGESRKTTANIDIINKTDKPGIDIIIKPNTKNESVHIPVILSKEGLNDMVYNTFEVGANSDVVIIAGCGIHSCGTQNSEHSGVHEFFVRENAKMKYVEKHYGDGNGSGERIMNPKTFIEAFENSVIELEMDQIKGIDSTIRDTEIILHKNAKLIITERLLTDGKQKAESNIIVNLEGEDSSAQVISRSVAQGDSVQNFDMELIGKEKSRGHIQCDSIITGNAKVSSSPKISAIHSEAELIHEATVGRIASDQLTKLMTIGITEEEAEEIIIKGFLG
ncbi:SufB/SufD family protein [Fusobacterium sp. MFO224]|uniref:SufB/SufD family protein n=1 Tax=Fusobacterium sp. MFO224 TaxID=3378070 RepID=UPI0038552F52